MKSRFLLVTALCLLGGLIAGNVAEARALFLPGAKNCPSAYAQWKSRKDHRWSAFAVNNWNSTGQACGYTFRYSTKDRAFRGALRKCNLEEQTTRSGRRGTCRVLGVK